MNSLMWTAIMDLFKIIAIFVIALMTIPETHADLLKLTPAPSPADNPLKGLVTYSHMAGETFPHSMEFEYMPLSELMVGAESFDWQPLETLLDQGVAPFYRDWRIELAALDAAGRIAQSWPVDWKITDPLPGDAPREWTATLNLVKVPNAQLTLALRVINPMPNGKPLRFANAEQDRHAPGWLSLGPLP